MEPSKRPILRPIDKSSFSGIVIDIDEDLKILLECADNAGREPLPPDMAVLPEDAIEPHRKDTQYPLHYRGKALPFGWLDDKVEMRAQDAEILEPECVLGFGVLDYHHEQLLHLVSAHYHFFAIGARIDMIPGSIFEQSGLSHACSTSMRSPDD
jgi:hypothetical protein